jgi:hypothetical protein
MTLAPPTVQNIPDCLTREPITVLQPASTTPEPINRCWRRNLGGIRTGADYFEGNRTDALEASQPLPESGNGRLCAADCANRRDLGTSYAPAVADGHSYLAIDRTARA